MTATLYEIEHRRLELYEALTSEDEATRKQAEDELLALGEVRDEKLAGCCAHLKNLIAEANLVRGEAKRLQERAKDCEARAERFQKYIESCLPDKTERWTNGLHSISWRRCPPSVLVLDEKKVPAAYLREKVEYSVDKKQALIDLANKATIPGLALEIDKFNLTVK